ncbi:MAG TPA: Ger(x)C family spore germination protein [Firmicutes bacterium]|nr:Ger(x)C family spore germination protein [Bacillota bacterium]HOQ24101.1 Ger(x)C family spore germination protein [Bacillota bacterium]HPT66407.1 Ger(x)C family spore germination protein [Bacillota bacterium]
MRRLLRTTLALTLVLTVSVFSSIGCWDKKELDKLAIVAGFGVDQVQTAEGDRLLLTAQIIKADQVISPEQAGGSGKQSFLTDQSYGRTVFEGVRNFTFESSRRLFFPHNRVLIIGESLARSGLHPIIDFFIRDPEPRPKQYVLVAKGKAADILSVKTGLEEIPALAIYELLQDYGATSKVYPVTLQDLTKDLASKTKTAVLPMIELVSTSKKKTIMLDGTAVFKSDRMVGELNINETRGLLWVLGKVHSGIIVFKLPPYRHDISMEILEANRQIRPELRNGKPHVTVVIDVEMIIGEITLTKNLTVPRENEKLERMASQGIKKEIRAALAKARQFNTDFFGFGEAFHSRRPKAWKTFGPNWDQIFPQLPVEIKVSTVIRRVGEATKFPILQ